MILYEQSEATAARRTVTFVCVDDTDGKTAETGLTFSSSEVSVRKPAGSYAAVTNIGTITEIADGEYELELTATELNTLGPLHLKIEKTGVRTTIMLIGQVVPWDPYASALPANVTTWNGTAVATPTTAGVPRVDVKAMEANVVTAAAIADAAIDLATLSADALLALGILASGTAQAGGALSITLASGASAVDDFYNEIGIEIYDGTGAGQTNQIDDYTGATKVATVARAWATEPDSSSKYRLRGQASPTAAAQMTWEGIAIEGSDTAGDLLRGIVATLFGELAGLDAVRAAGGTGDVTFKAADGTTTRITVTMSTDGRTTIVRNTLAA